MRHLAIIIAVLLVGACSPTVNIDCGESGCGNGNDLRLDGSEVGGDEKPLTLEEKDEIERAVADNPGNADPTARTKNPPATADTNPPADEDTSPEHTGSPRQRDDREIVAGSTEIRSPYGGFRFKGTPDYANPKGHLIPWLANKPDHWGRGMGEITYAGESEIRRGFDIVNPVWSEAVVETAWSEAVVDIGEESFVLRTTTEGGDVLHHKNMKMLKYDMDYDLRGRPADGPPLPYDNETSIRVRHLNWFEEDGGKFGFVVLETANDRIGNDGTFYPQHSLAISGVIGRNANAPYMLPDVKYPGFLDFSDVRPDPSCGELYDLIGNCPVR